MIEILNKFEKNIRLALAKSTKNKKEYLYYLKNERFKFIEDIENIREFGYKALKQNKVDFDTSGINLKFFDYKTVAEQMLNSGWVLIKDIHHEYTYFIAIKLIPPEKFMIEVREILSMKIEIKAESRQNAIDKVEEMYRNSEIVLNSEDFKACNIF